MQLCCSYPGFNINIKVTQVLFKKLLISDVGTQIVVSTNDATLEWEKQKNKFYHLNLKDCG